MSKAYPQKARYGVQNGRFKHGGYVFMLLTEEERQLYETREKEYLEAYPYLKTEPAMTRMLHELLLTEIMMDRMNAFIMDPHIPIMESAAASKRLDGLRRTYSLYLARMGITFQSRERRKVEPRRRKAIEALEDEEIPENEPEITEIQKPQPAFIWICPECGTTNCAIKPAIKCRKCGKELC